MENVSVREQILTYEPRLRKFAYSLTQDWHAANDLFQDTVYKALKYCKKFKEGSNLIAWLTTIMKNTFINSLRKKDRFYRVENDLKKRSQREMIIANDAEQHLAIEFLLNRVAELPDNLRIPFNAYLEGLQYKEISKELNVPLGTIKSRIFQARKSLHESIKNHN